MRAPGHGRTFHETPAAATDAEGRFELRDIPLEDPEDFITVEARDPARGLLGAATYAGDGKFDYDPDGQFEHLALGEQARNRDEQWLVDTVRRQAEMAGIGRPEVAIFDAPEMNAFATGM